MPWRGLAGLPGVCAERPDHSRSPLQSSLRVEGVDAPVVRLTELQGDGTMAVVTRTLITFIHFGVIGIIPFGDAGILDIGLVGAEIDVMRNRTIAGQPAKTDGQTVCTTRP